MAPTRVGTDAGAGLRGGQHMLLIAHDEGVERWDELLGKTRLGQRMRFPYVGMTDAVVSLVRD